MKYVLVALFLGLVLGCSQKQPDAHLMRESMLNFSISNTKKIELGEGQNRSYITITYLNPIAHELITQEREKFIVGSYGASGAREIPKIALANFEINGLSKEEIRVRKVLFGDPLLSLIPSANPWTEYLLIEAPKTQEIQMMIRFENDQFSQVSVNFQKDY